MIGQRYVKIKEQYGYLGFYTVVGYDREKELYILRYEKTMINSYIGVSVDDLKNNFVSSYDALVKYRDKLNSEIEHYKDIIRLKDENAMVRTFFRKIAECKNELDIFEKYYTGSEQYSIKLAQLNKGIRRAKKVLYRYFKTKTDFVVDSINTLDYNMCYGKIKHIKKIDSSLTEIKEFFDK